MIPLRDVAVLVAVVGEALDTPVLANPSRRHLSACHPAVPGAPLHDPDPNGGAP